MPLAVQIPTDPLSGCPTFIVLKFNRYTKIGANVRLMALAFFVIVSSNT